MYMYTYPNPRAPYIGSNPDPAEKSVRRRTYNGKRTTPVTSRIVHHGDAGTERRPEKCRAIGGDGDGNPRIYIALPAH